MKTVLKMAVTGLFVSYIAFAVPAKAQQNLSPDRDKPLEINADQTLEWRRAETRFIANGNVVVTQGEVHIAADTITADYRETAESSFDIYRLTAEGNVTISSQGNIATGDRAIYDVDKGTAVMTGNALKLAGPDQTVTARDSFDYDVAAGKLTASGAAHVVRGADTLDTDQLSAVFADDPVTGERRLKTLIATGNVRITTPEEVLTGERGQYDSATNTAEIHGNVKITRGPNVLEGDSADVNLTTNVSTMKGAPGENGRVRGVFYPGSDDMKKTPLGGSGLAPAAPQPLNPGAADSKPRARLLAP